MLWTPAAVAAATGGRVVGGAGRELFTSVGIDSRRCCAGSLFVAVRGVRDGHDFVAAALRAGAAGFLFEADRLDLARIRREAPEAVAIEVADPGRALLDLGRQARSRLAGPVVGITGSLGKTSTKDLTAATLGAARRVAASERSFNNELGVPLTLANAPEDTEVAVVEMGARGIGHIALLCQVARPSIAIVTAIAAVHTEQFGSIDAVAQAKGELVEALPSTGLAVLNADDARVSALAGRTTAAVLRYSATGRTAAGEVATDVAEVFATHVKVGTDLRPSFELVSPWGSGPVRLGVRGAHQIGNALAAATVALHQGVAWEAVVAALAAASISPWRMELGTTPAGATILNDAYNASPASMAAALRSLALLPARRRIAVLGTMAELGPDGGAEHRAIAALAEELGVELVAVGTADYGRTPVAGIDEALAALGPLAAGDAVLVKGSRVVGLERLAARLVAPTA